MKTILIAAVTVVVSAWMLAACDVEVQKDEGASEALAAAEAKLAQMASYDAEIAAVKTWREVWDSAEVDKLDAIANSDYKRTAPDLDADSLDELKAFILQVHATYPDFNITNDGMAAGPDGVFMQWTVTGSDTARGEDSTGNSMNITGISRYRFSDGKISSELVIFDTGSALTQLETSELPHTAE
ncbi:MAG: ester cyclase [Gammaproteobacteria bacterium]|nr:ester cyclase [Gammaproteobacteria bacterium]MDH3433080.1 ester cyclase [Gammaproteobacteria bacterium]